MLCLICDVHYVRGGPTFNHNELSVSIAILAIGLVVYVISALSMLFIQVDRVASDAFVLLELLS